MTNEWFRNFVNRVRQHVRRIQYSDDRTKRRWLAGITAVVMVMVVVLWVVYLNIAVPAIVGSEVVVQADTQKSDNGDDSLLTTFTRGVSVLVNQVGQAFSNMWQAIAGVVTSVKELSFEGASDVPTVETSEPLPPTPLP